MSYRIRRPDGAPRESTSQSQLTDENWERRLLRDVLLEAYQEQKRARIWRNVWRGVGVLMFFGVIASSISGGSDKQNPTTTRTTHTAVIDLDGVIGGDDYVDQVEILREGLQAAYKNKHAKAIIIHANSPGGSPVVSNVAFEEIRRLKGKYPDKKVYWVMRDMCASGCYYIAAAADTIYADPSSLVGSIGVIGSSFDATGLMDKLGVKRRQRIAGNNKGMGDPFTPETPEQQAIWQQMLDQIHQEFIKAVKTGRGERLKVAENPDLFSGRIYTGVEAKKVGLIDDFGNVYSVSRDVIKAPELVNYTPQRDNLARLLSRRLGAEVKSQAESWLNHLW